MDNLAIPIGISRLSLISVISAWHRARGYEQELSAGEVAKKTSMKRQNVQRQSAFLTQIGMLQKVGSKYHLTKAGESMARYAEYSQFDEFHEVFRTLVSNWDEFQPVVDYMKDSESVNYITLTKRIMMYSGRAPSDRNVFMGAQALIDLLERAGILWIEEDNVRILDEMKSDSESDKTKTDPLTDQLEVGKRFFASDYDFSISRIVIKNVKSIVNVEFPVKKMNIFIGKNAAGKSSILHAILALRNLKWDRSFTEGAYHNLSWLKRKGSDESMYISLLGDMDSSSDSHKVRLSVAFAPSLSNCTQLCVQDNADKVCDTSISLMKQDLLIPFDLFEGLDEIREASDRVKEGVIKISDFLTRYVDHDRELITKTDLPAQSFVSIMEDETGTVGVNSSARRFLSSWMGLLPEFLRSDDKQSTRESYLAARSLISQCIDNLEFVPVVRGFLKINYEQKDSLPNRIPDDIGFALHILGKMMYQDHIDESTLNGIRTWAARFGIEGFETVIQPGHRVEGRGWIMDGKESLPVSLYGFGSNQFLTVICKCALAPKRAPFLIEEPEIHLHPELQALTADFLIDMMKDKHQLFITTHSEHLIGRIQRRIAEGVISSDDVAILWVKHESAFNGTVVEEVEMDANGIFHKGLETYLKFMESEMKAIEHARQQGSR